MVIQQRMDRRLEVVDVDLVYLRCDAQRHAEPLCHLDRPVDALLGTDTPEESEVVPGRLVEMEDVLREPVIDGGRPVHPGHGRALVVGDGDVRQLTEGAVQAHQIREI
jgi:hypothetical protein